MASLEGKYLTFALGEEEYGIGILKVKEIIGMMPVVQIPKAPEYIKGIINLRGMVIPILDLRLRFGMEAADYNEKTCIIVVEAHKAESMQKCWEVKGCGKKDCPGYESSDLRCWMISGTFCRDEIQRARSAMCMRQPRSTMPCLCRVLWWTRFQKCCQSPPMPLKIRRHWVRSWTQAISLAWPRLMIK